MATYKSESIGIQPDKLPEHNDASTPESDHESESSFNTTGPFGSTESLTSLPTPRQNLLWDHGFDIANSDKNFKSPTERELQWRKFNKTDDDKLEADKKTFVKSYETKCMKQATNSDAEEPDSSSRPGLCNDLPDLISSMPSLIDVENTSNNETSALINTIYDTLTSDEDRPPPLPDTKPPAICKPEKPPPLSRSSQPSIDTETKTVGNDEKNQTDNLHTVSEQCILKDSKDKSDVIDVSIQNNHSIKIDEKTNTKISNDISNEMLVKNQGYVSDKEQFDREVEEEFEAIINALDLNYMDETYVERFADRRDRYGFILSPVIEAPSPTPSSLSGYSGLSSASPDPLSMFRVSPRPGSRTDIDLTSLGIDPDEWDINLDNTVPIYQTVQARRALVIPEGYGWESGDEVLSGSGEWETDDGSLKSPPLSTSSVSLSQFGSHVVGWKQPDSVIVEEPEIASADNSDTDTDKTLKDESEEEHFVSNESLSDETAILPVEMKKTSEEEHIYGADISTLDCQIKQGGDEDWTNTLTAESENVSDYYGQTCIENYHEIYIKRDVAERKSEDQTDQSIHEAGKNCEITNLRDKSNNRFGLCDSSLFKISNNVEENHREASGRYSNMSNKTSENRSSADSSENSQDEISETDESDANDNSDETNSDTEFFHKKRNSLQRALTLNRSKLSENNVDKHISVSEVISPRTSLLLAGGMFPLYDSESSSFTSESESDTEKEGSHGCVENTLIDDDKGNKIEMGTGEVDLDILVLQYTSDDSAKSDCSDISGEDQNASNIVSFRRKYHQEFQIESFKEDKLLSTESDIGSSTSTPTFNVSSPLDFSIFGGKLDGPGKSKEGRSPRVLGRHYSEMDDDIVSQSLSPTIESKLQDTMALTFDARKTSEENDSDTDLFENVNFTYPSNATELTDNRLIEHNLDEISSDSSESEMFSPAVDSQHSDRVDFNNILEQPNNLVIHNAFNGKRKTPPVTKALSKKQQKVQRRSPVQIKISSLKRKDSTINKIKKGFVQQLSEIFTKRQSNSQGMWDSPVKQRKPHDAEHARVRLPQLLTANENMIISRSSVQREIQDKVDIQEGSLGFDVSPLESVFESFDSFKEASVDDPKVDVETISPQNDLSSDTSDESQANTEVIVYEGRLREIEKEEDDYQDQKKASGVDNDNRPPDLESVNKQFIFEDDNEYVKDMNLFRKWNRKSTDNIVRNEKTFEDSESVSKLSRSHQYLHDNNNKNKGSYIQQHQQQSQNLSIDISCNVQSMNNSKQIPTPNVIPGCELIISKPSQSLSLHELLNRAVDKSNDPINSPSIDPTNTDITYTDEISDYFGYKEHIDVNVETNSSPFRSIDFERNGSGEIQSSRRKRYFCKEKDGAKVPSKADWANNNKIQYPPSLSRRLYGPYVRQKQKSPQPSQERKDIPQQREITPPTLFDSMNTSPSMTNCMGRQQSVLLKTETVTYREGVGKRPMEFDRTSDEQKQAVAFSLNDGKREKIDCIHFDVDKHKCSFAEKKTQEMHTEENTFQHTLYKVNTPISSIKPSFKGDVPFNLKPITHCVRNEATSLYHSQDNFANANIRSSECPQAINTDAKNDKIHFNFLELERLKESKENKQPVNSCGGILHRYSYAVCEDSVLTPSCENKFYGNLKNGIFQQKMGVFPTTEDTASVDMINNSKLREKSPLSQAYSVREKVNSLAINDPTSTQTVTVNQAYMSVGKDLSHQRDSRGKAFGKSVPAAWTEDKQVSVVVLPPGCKHVLEDERGNLKVWPYSDFDNSDKLSVTLHKANSRMKVTPKGGMNNNSSNMTIIQSAQHSAEMPENKMVKKYHSSSVMPTDNSDRNILQTHADSIKTVLLQDANGNMVSEEELAKILPKIANTVANSEINDAEEILPGITQSVTKLRNGGNLVITTMTRKLDEIENDSSGRASPELSHPILNVDDLENSKIYLVEDSNGELFYVEDITSDTQESAYFSSSRNTSESMSDGANSPQFKRISKIQQVGESGINNSTAEEILTAMYNQGTVQEITENEEEWSERTYEYDIPGRRQDSQPNGYSKDSFRTSYVVEEPDTIPRTKTTTKDRFESVYEVAENQPWVIDGGQMQSYSHATQVHGVDKTDAGSTIQTDYVTRRENARPTYMVNQPGHTSTHERYTVEADAQLFPMAPYQYPVMQPPVFVPPPPVCIPAENPQYSLVKVDVKPQKAESVTSSADVTENNKVIEIDERPIFKTVAHIQTGEKHPSVKSDMTEKKKYRIISSKASPAKEEEQETHMSFGEVDYKYTSESLELVKSPSLQTKQFFVRDSTKLEQQKQSSEQRFRSEKKLQLAGGLDKRNTTTIEVKGNQPSNNFETYEERTYSFDQMRGSMEPADDNMRVIRGSYLIKNNLEEVDGTLDDNINMFDGNFVLSKENPLYQSDEDLYRKFEKEKAEHAYKQDRFQRDYRQDMTFETVDKFSKSKTGKCYFVP